MGRTGVYETEVKFFMPELGVFREQLVKAGAILTKPRVFEQNVRFDTPDNQLLQRRELLRLRQDTAVTITFKGSPDELEQGEVKRREEIEVNTTDFDNTVTIFKRLGFEPKQVYEKYRETFQLGALEIVLDEMPFGNFIELEGEEEAIKTAVARLGLPWEKRILTNYLMLMAQLQAFHKLPFMDLTFANFEQWTVSVADILPYHFPSTR